MSRPYPALAGKKVLLSLGHTRDKWDDVRFLSNRSSGKTGLALARAFWLAGAQVEVVAGVREEEIPPGMDAVEVESSEDFRREMLARQATADVVVMAAAVADFVPAQTHAGKIKGSKSLDKIELRPFPNVLDEMGRKKPSRQILVGFALETENALAHGEAKMRERNCDFMVVNNPVTGGAGGGFGRDKVLACLLTRGKASPALAEWEKDQLANALLAGIQALLEKA
jgi:phosphopantothenoylcysteine decarboxylase/phosphopantothenate--cysteine ligase